MKKWKSPLIIFALIIALSLFLFFVPLDNIVRNLPILKGFYENTSLEITTPNGKATVKLNEKEYGETPATIQNLFAGEYDVELTRTAQEEGFYKSHSFPLELTKNTTSRINIEIGPDNNLHGFLLYYTQDNTISSGSGQIMVTSNANGAKIYLDNEYLDIAPITNLELTKGEYTISMTKKDYEDLTFPVLVEEGYILNIKGYQFPVPVTFESVQNDE